MVIESRHRIPKMNSFVFEYWKLERVGAKCWCVLKDAHETTKKIMLNLKNNMVLY
jgi:hypothetical protein